MAGAALAARLQRDERPELRPQRTMLTLVAVLGAVAGAFLGELPADAFGWAWRPPLTPADALPLGGRTVLGGLIGGWLAVEALKWRLGIRGSTGDGFALPLAIALTAGRLGCASAGCCAGQICDAGAWYLPFSAHDVLGQPRIPVPAIEVAFHASVAVLLIVAARCGWWCGRRLAAYLTAYAVLRFLLEFLRDNPPLPGLTITWYQVLALGLLALAGSTWYRRARAARQADAAGPEPMPAAREP